MHPADDPDDRTTEAWADGPPDPLDVDAETEISLLNGGVCVRQVGSSTEWLQYLGPVDIERVTDGATENAEKSEE